MAAIFYNRGCVCGSGLAGWWEEGWYCLPRGDYHYAYADTPVPEGRLPFCIDCAPDRWLISEDGPPSRPDMNPKGGQ